MKLAGHHVLCDVEPAVANNPIDTPMDATIFTGGFDRPYAFGLSVALASKGVQVEVIGSDAVDSPEMHSTQGLRFLNLLGSWRADASIVLKVLWVVRFYTRLVSYSLRAKPSIFHILWNNKLTLFDRTALMLFYKACGKRIVLTVHNVNTRKRDKTDTTINRLSLKLQYLLVDHLFVHTEKMREELIMEFGIQQGKITVIPFGINNSLPVTEMSATEAKMRLGLTEQDRVLLFFGRIQSYKGLEYLVDALALLTEEQDASYRLIIAGEPMKEYQHYWNSVECRIMEKNLHGKVLQKIGFIPDRETEVYFKAADVAVLPYTDIYQSGVLFLGYSFGLPAIATDVGCFSDEVVEGRTGFLARRCDALDLARVIRKYFESDLYRQLASNKILIRDYVAKRHSWDEVVAMTCRVYQNLRRGERA